MDSRKVLYQMLTLFAILFGAGDVLALTDSDLPPNPADAECETCTSEIWSLDVTQHCAPADAYASTGARISACSDQCGNATDPNAFLNVILLASKRQECDNHWWTWINTPPPNPANEACDVCTTEVSNFDAATNCTSSAGYASAGTLLANCESQCITSTAPLAVYSIFVIEAKRSECNDHWWNWINTPPPNPADELCSACAINISGMDIPSNCGGAANYGAALTQIADCENQCNAATDASRIFSFITLEAVKTQCNDYWWNWINTPPTNPADAECESCVNAIPTAGLPEQCGTSAESYAAISAQFASCENTCSSATSTFSWFLRDAIVQQRNECNNIWFAFTTGITPTPTPTPTPYDDSGVA